MPSEPNRPDYRRGTRQDKTAGAGPSGLDPLRTEFLQALARASRQYRTYPATSPLCTEAVDACHRAFVACDVGARLLIRITPRDLIVDDVQVGRGTLVEQELARPLHRARVASIEIDRSASLRDWSLLFANLTRVQRSTAAKITLAELLAEDGVAAILPHSLPHPEVLELGAPPPPVCALVERERERQAAAIAGAPAQYFYPPDKGWVRLDPTVGFETISLVDLAVLLDDPAELATMLMRLTDDDAEMASGSAAIEQKYGDIVTVLSALDPRLARVLFAKLARAVLRLDPERRKALLRRTILPGLLDGRSDAEAVLTDFPDVDLADALCLLLDLETAAPEVISTALDRLALPIDRRTSLVPIIEHRLASAGARSEARASRPLEWYAGALIRVSSTGGKSFAEFAAFDLSMSDATVAALAAVRDTICTADAADARLRCLAHLSRLEPNPTLVAAFMDSAGGLLRTLARQEHWDTFAGWAGRFASTAHALLEARPDVADAIRRGLERVADREFVVGVAELCDGSAHERALLDSIIAALGSAMIPAWSGALDTAADHARVRTLLPAICERAGEFGPTLARQLAKAGPAASRAIVTALGFTRGRYETLLASQIERGDEHLGREAIRSLARIGSREAAGIVGERLEHGPAWARKAAEDALWRFPHVTAVVTARNLLARRSFVVREPELAERLLDRAAQADDVDLGPVLDQLAPLRFRFWSPALVRIAARARELR